MIITQRLDRSIHVFCRDLLAPDVGRRERLQ
jgi:hypothetical protein